MTVIVMLILAGVSLNALVGDNGIITNAQSASVKNGMAILEEFLQESYVKVYDDVKKDETKIETMERYYSDYFYIPSLPENGAIGNLRYIVDSEGHAYYLIKKSGLPQEIKDALKGGEAGNGTYRDYLALNDVYGVTSDLKVYYSSGLGQDLLSLNGAILDNDTPNRTIFNSVENGLGKSLISYDTNGDGILTNTEIGGIRDIEISENIEDLGDLYNFVNLEKIIIENATISSLKGIENCPNINYIKFTNSVVGDYSGIGNVGSTLKYLYFVDTTNEEVNKLGNGLKNYDLENLEYLGFYRHVEENETYYWDVLTFRTCHNENTELSDISALSMLSDKTKKAVRYLYIPNNKISSLECLSGFDNLYYVRAQNNQIENLKGLENKNSLTYMCLRKNNLTDVIVEDDEGTNEDESLNSVYCLNSLQNNFSLYWLDLSDNPNLKIISYLGNCSALQNLNLGNNTSLSKNDVASIKNKLNSLAALVIDTSYSWSLIDSANTKRLDLRGQTIKRSDFELLSTCTNLTYLDIGDVNFVKDDGTTKLTSAELNTMLNLVLPNFTKVVELCLCNLKFDDFSFYSSMSAITILDLHGTNVTTSGTNGLTLLNTYKHVGTMRISNSGIDLSRIQPALTYMFAHTVNMGGTGRTEHILNNYTAGLNVENSTIMKTLEKCTDLTSINSTQQGYYFRDNNLELDLSNLTKLTYFNYCYVFVKNIKLPASIQTLSITAQSGKYTFDTKNDATLGATNDLTYVNIREYSETNDLFTKLVSYCKKLTKLQMYENFMNEFDFGRLKTHNALNYIIIFIPTWTVAARYTENLKTLNSLSTLSTLNEIDITYSTLTNLDCVKSLSNLKILKIYQCDLKDISGLSGMTSLTELDLTECKIVDISPVKYCTNLIHLELWSNSISTGFKGLLDLKKLSYLSLSMNSITDYDVMNDERYFVQDVFVQMNKTKSGNVYKLENLYIRENKFTDFSRLTASGVVWSAKNGF